MGARRSTHERVARDVPLGYRWKRGSIGKVDLYLFPDKHLHIPPAHERITQFRTDQLAGVAVVFPAQVILLVAVLASTGNTERYGRRSLLLSRNQGWALQATLLQGASLDGRT